MELSVVILNWNAAADTIRCVHELMAWQQLQPLIVVVDNASTDDSADRLKVDCPQVQIICNDTNQGYAGGNNRGIETALALSNGPIMLLNNDASVAESDAIRLLETLQADERIGFIGPVLFDADDRDRLLSAGSKDPTRHHHSHNHQLPTGEPVHPVECIPGTVIIGRAEVFRTCGLLDEDYFFASEVADLCMVASRRGYLNVIDARARAYHGLKRSSNLRGTLYVYYIIRNRFLLIRKFHQKWKALYFALWTLYGLTLSLKLGLEGQHTSARSVWLGLRDGLQGRFGNQNERVLVTGSARAGEH